MGQREHHWQSDSGAMTVWYKLFVKDFNLLKLCFFILTSYFLYGELRLFFDYYAQKIKTVQQKLLDELIM